MKKKIRFDGVYVKDELLVEILSRLPAKSLMRFKCVSKSWLYLIENDKYFLSLHTCQLLKSQQQQLLITCSDKKCGTSFFTLDLFQPNKYVKEYLGQWEKDPYWQSYNILVSAYGLVCYVNYKDYSVRIYNNCIREETPWIRSNIGKDFTKRFDYKDIPVCGFGFDPITQKHKVVFMWLRPRKNRDKSRDFEEVPLCEVLTVGENIWRTVDTNTPMKNVCGGAIYANGSLYWLDSPFCAYYEERKCVDSIIAFDVGEEKLRIIKYPSDIFKNRLPGAYYYQDLLEVDGHLALMDKNCYDEKGNLSNTVMKLWIYIDEDGKENRWIEEPFELPCHVKHNAYRFKSIAGTNKLMITRRTRPKNLPEDYDDIKKSFGLYIYDSLEKKWNEYGDLTNPRNKSQKEFFMHPYRCESSIIVQSIYPVRTPNK